MSEAARRKLLVVVSENPQQDKATIAFTIANASLTAGMEVGVFLVSNGVELARAGSADAAVFKPFKPLGDLVEAFVQNGGRVFACGSCWQHRGLDESRTAEGITVSGVSAAVDWIAAGAQILSL